MPSKPLTEHQLAIWLERQERNYKNKTHEMRNEDIRKKWENFVLRYSHLFDTSYLTCSI